MMKPEVTFILPTADRAEFVCRAINSCLAAETARMGVRVLVIDGMSTDGTPDLVRTAYASDPRVSLVQHPRIGFQRTAYFGALQVTTEYASFMYDDDIISPYYGDVFDRMLAEEAPFAMGLGENYDIHKVYPFKPLMPVLAMQDKYDVVSHYFGVPMPGRWPMMPVSPICIVVKTAFLRDWVQFTQNYASRSKIRQYFMIDRNIGPDIILFISSILRGREKSLLAQETIGQFSEHSQSMSVGYGGAHLEVGYWFGKLWGFEEIARQGNRQLAGRAAAYLLFVGAKILLMMMRNNDRKWAMAFAWEVAQLKIAVIARGLLFPALANIPTVVRIRLGKAPPARRGP